MSIKKLSIEKSLKNVAATLAFENLRPSRTAINMSKQVLEGKITGTEARAEILKNYNVQVKSNV
ncbi:antitoxin VbhA family protein [Fusibacter ferrireducens]|uniref:Antitoxin VbhA family protein n=1 Tax=Fusibacter ferrireducens TaxID=2785058 RepID=A0ABS0A0K3_9FIRM|nr:antitoxin VbhA family protein [Fusibacter ferrireducens]MBF4695973.1 antitoxin VbhA family protein [Fusibacter ferrireducens]